MRIEGGAFEVDEPEWLAMGPIGPPGRRVFFVQVESAGERLSMLLEKEQVRTLASEVLGLLEESTRRRAGETTRAEGVWTGEVLVNAGEVALPGTLSVPESAGGLVIFAHGSGSSRHSPRNEAVARTLRSASLATVLFDLLIEREVEVMVDELRVRQVPRQPVPALRQRLVL